MQTTESSPLQKQHSEKAQDVIEEVPDVAQAEAIEPRNGDQGEPCQEKQLENA